jgi:hypothetical protein
MKSHLTDCGIPGIAEIPYGFHMCHFYPSGRVLLDGLIAYFQAGVRNNELCLWVGSLPLPASDIHREVTKYPDLVKAAESGQLRILDALDWFGEPSVLDAGRMVQRWIAEEEHAALDGFEGLRATSNISFVPAEHWHRFIEYERVLHESLPSRRILIWCTYDREDCGPVELMEVAGHHHAVLEKGSKANRDDHYWEVFMPESHGKIVQNGRFPAA